MNQLYHVLALSFTRIARHALPLRAVVLALVPLCASSSAFAAAQFLAVGDNGTLLQSADGLTWTTLTSGTNKRLRGVATNSTTLVAVGETGTILTSTDATTWSARFVPTTVSLRGIAVGPSGFVVVGGMSSALALTSTDGLSWASITPTGGALRGVAWGSNKFVAVGNGGTILTSPNGTAWTTQTSGTTDRLDGIVWTGSKFYALSALGSVLTSTDGDTWTKSQAYPPSWIEGFSWNGSRLVAVGAQGQISTSTDGTAWTATTSTTAVNLHGVTWTGTAPALNGDPIATLGNIDFRIINSPVGQTVSAALSATFNVVASAPNAVYQWLKNGAAITGATNSTLIVPNVQNTDAGNYSVRITNGTVTQTSSAAALVLRGSGSTGQQFVAVGQSGTILTSPDGVTWTGRTSGTTRRLRAVAASDATFVAVGEAGTILTSADGITWSSRSVAQNLRGVAFGTDRFVAVGGATDSYVTTSNDGTVWTQATVPTLGSLRGVAWGSGVFIAVGQNGTILRSVDGRTWSSITVGTSQRLDGVVWTGSQFTIVSQAGQLLTSADGLSWSSSSSSPPPWIEGLAWNSTHCVVVGANGTIATSTNGSFWSGAVSGTSATIHGVTWSGSASPSTLNLATSLNALAQKPLITTAPVGALVGTGGAATFKATVWGGVTYQWQRNGTPLTDGTKYSGSTSATLTITNVQATDAGTYSITVGNSFGSATANAPLALRGQGNMGNQFVAVGDNGTILTSADGSTWTAQASGTSRRIRSVVAGPTQFAAVTENGAVLVSNDGATWTSHQSQTTGTLRGIAASPTRFVAVGGDAAATIVVSTNGTLYNAVPVTAAGNLRGITYGIGGFVAVGRNGTIITSADGLSWTSQTSGTTERIEGVVWTGSQYAAVTQSGALLTSVDGASWTSSSASLPVWAEGLAWNTSRYVVVGASGRVATSTDGALWTTATSPTTATLHGVAWSGATFTPTGNPATLFANLQAAPSITTQPAAAITTVGSSATLWVNTTGAGATFQWYKNGLAVAGATSSSLTIASTVGRDAGSYSVKVSNTNGSVTSATVPLTIAPVYTFTTLAGSPGQLGSADGTGSNARFSVPLGLALDSAGNIYVSDAPTNIIRKITPTGVVTTIAGAPSVTGSTDGPGATARFFWPAGLAADSNNSLYIADQSNRMIRKISPDNIVSTVAGAVGPGGNVDGQGSVARFQKPGGLAVDAQGFIYTADEASNHTIRKITPSGYVTTIAGQAGMAGYQDGPGTQALFYHPMDIALDTSHIVYVADYGNQAIRRISLTGIVDTLVTNSSILPRGLTCDQSGNLFVSSDMNQILIVNSGGAFRAIGGTIGGSADGTEFNARFQTPTGIKVDANGVLYIADTYNHTIRVGTPSFVLPSITTQPVGQSVSAGGSVTLSVTAAGTGPFTYQWLKDGAPITGATNAGFSIASAQLSDAGSYTVVATGFGGAITSSAAAVAINATLPAFTTHPASVSVLSGQSANFTVAATGTPAPTLQWRLNGNAIAGATSTSLSLSSVSAANAGSYDVVATNAAGSVTSTAATLTVTSPPPPVIIVPPISTNTAPAITSGPASQTAAVGQTVSFSVTASGSPTPSYQWRKNGAALSGANGSTLTLANVTGADAGSYDVVVSNSAGSVTSGTATLAVDQAPVISTPPLSITVERGTSAVFTVAVTASPAPSYQWRKDGATLVGATSASLTIPSVADQDVGDYSVVVTNRAGTATSSAATLTVSGPPTITSQPVSQVVLAGGSVTFTVVAKGATTYQWRKNGLLISGANSESFTLGAVQASDAGSYDVLVGNGSGTTASAVASLNVTAAAVAPAITSQPAARTAVAGADVSFTAVATGAPNPNYQWRKNGGPIAGGTNSTLQIAAVRSEDAGDYDVVVTNSAGSATSSAAQLKVLLRSYAGVYFGSFGESGRFALYIREDNTGVLLGYLAGSNSPAFSIAVSIDDNGRFSVTSVLTSTVGHDGDTLRAAAASEIAIAGTISLDGNLAGTVSGPTNTTLSGSKTPATGATQAMAGYYVGGNAGTSAASYTIVSADGQAFLLTQTAQGTDAGLGNASATGGIAVTTNSGGTATGTVNGNVLSTTVKNAQGQQTAFDGAPERVTVAQRMINVSSRAHAGSGDATAIAGFVISGEQSKPVLIRAVGPTLASFGVSGTLTAPKLEVYRGSSLIAQNNGWTNAGNTEELAALANRVGAFTLKAGSADAAIYLNLEPGAYTAQMSGNGGAGIGLIEMYDLAPSSASGQKLINISTRAVAGSGDSSLIAGFVISGVVPKRILVRAVGPTLGKFGLTGVLDRPQLVLYQGSKVIAQNAGWSSSVDATGIAAAAQQVGAFALSSGSLDAALLVSLEPGSYSAQVVGTSSGVAMVEIYEVP